MRVWKIISSKKRVNSGGNGDNGYQLNSSILSSMDRNRGRELGYLEERPQDRHRKNFIFCQRQSKEKMNSVSDGHIILTLIQTETEKQRERGKKK